MSGKVVLFDEATILGLPKATDEDPFAQIKWIFEERRKRTPSNSGKKNYASALQYYLRFIEETEGNRPFVLKERWGLFSLIQYVSWMNALRDENGDRPIGAAWRVTIVSCVRQVLQEAQFLGLIASETILQVSMAVPVRETNAHDAYSNEELAAILELVRSEMQYTNAVLAGYKHRNVGRDPRERPPKGSGIAPRYYPQNGYGWVLPENMHWYFENVMKCVPVSRVHPDGPTHQRFLSSASNYHGGYPALYREWGVTVHIDREVLWPLAVQLGYLTGLNPESLAELKFDCLSQHPLLGTPVLGYFKLRSEGEKELLLELLNNKEVPADAYEYVEIPLKRDHSILVQRCIDKILRLTQAVRENPACPKKMRDKLFVYQSSGKNCFGEIQTLSFWKYHQWCKKIGELHDLRTPDGARITFTPVRFRPTRLTEMAAQGKDIFEIQQAAGHKHIGTTLIYIEKRVLDDAANREVNEHLVVIWKNHNEFKPQESSYQPPSATSPFHGLISNCKNVFDPPNIVKLSADYVEGQGCTRFNMCLLCKNIVIMEEHLPILALYRTQIRVATEKDGVDLPHIHFYQKTLSVLDQIFDPDTSEFDESVLNEAVAASELLDLVIDPIVYPGGIS
ncbi:site-specific integrase [Herbaspirillum sp. LeCh32-8]|uniref:site-specific integrase n=1 Tax=Herbaspirillum sp. LeCh32-8 TaxID=2821356 RepID=UPI001AE122B6|nr:site-specific integrase [Herbaspirillum sp. LeCh32-8]MBP0597762.1 site-specific integrase [Herbaspirillum sp. LeCh32-8]